MEAKSSTVLVHTSTTNCRNADMQWESNMSLKSCGLLKKLWLRYTILEHHVEGGTTALGYSIIHTRLYRVYVQVYWLGVPYPCVQYSMFTRRQAEPVSTIMSLTSFGLLKKTAYARMWTCSCKATHLWKKLQICSGRSCSYKLWNCDYGHK